MLQTMWDKYKIPLIISCAVILVLAIYFSSTSESSETEEPAAAVFPINASKGAEVTEESEEKEADREIFVDVKGAVTKPGIYKAVQGERVNDLIIRAGGFTGEASEQSVNLALKIVDEMVIYVPVEGEQGLGAQSMIPEGQGEKEMLNINQAETEDFEKLPGIGPSKAAAIVDFRTEKGPFKTIDELMEVSGIGAGTFEKLKDAVTVH